MIATLTNHFVNCWSSFTSEEEDGGDGHFDKLEDFHTYHPPIHCSFLEIAPPPSPINVYTKWNWLPPDCCGNCNAIFLLKMGPKFTTLIIYGRCLPLLFTVTFILWFTLFSACVCFMKSIKITQTPVTLPYLKMATLPKENSQNF